MTDFVVSGGRSSAYPSGNYGAVFNGTTATFCLGADTVNPDANVLALPNKPVTVLTRNPITVTPQFFGVHVLNRVNDALPGGLRAGTVRSHDCANGIARWQYIETSPGVYGGLPALDAWVNAHYAAGRDIVFTVFGTPTLNASYSARPSELGIYGPSNLGIQAEPSDMTKLAAYVTAVATRYLGKIKYYEVWNEPNASNNGAGVTGGTSFFYSGTWASLAAMVRTVAVAVKAVDPTAKIICPPVQGWAATGTDTSGQYFTGMMVASDGAGGTMAQWCDIAGVHLYLPLSNLTADLPAIINRVSAAKTAAGVSALPTWDTESSPYAPMSYKINDSAWAQIIQRSRIVMAAMGIQRTIYYQYDNTTLGFMGRPACVALWNSLQTLMTSGSILSVSALFDGRISINTTNGALIL